MKLDFLRRKDRSVNTRATPGEINALQHVLRGDDPRLGLLVEQLRTTPEVRREQLADHLRVSPTSTFEDLNFVLEVSGLWSDWVTVGELISGRDLEFRAKIVRSGFLETLEGRTADGGQWPDVWDVTPPTDDVAAPPALVLPSLEVIDAAQRRARAELEMWLGGALRKDLTLYPPATAAAVHLREEDLGVRVTAQYRRLLCITDGVETGDIRALGHQDVYGLDHPELDGVVVAWDLDESDDFMAVLARDGQDETVRRLDIHDRHATLRAVAPDLASYLRERLRWK